MWLTGLTDGEGCFYANTVLHKWGGYRLSISFAISLREDDWEVIANIRRFLRCGTVQRKLNNGGYPGLVFRVVTIPDLHGIVVPHFDRYPFKSKKQRDYKVWREIVKLSWNVYPRVAEPIPGKRGMAKWTSDEKENLICLCSELKRSRCYREVGPEELRACGLEPRLPGTEEITEEEHERECTRYRKGLPLKGKG